MVCDGSRSQFDGGDGRRVPWRGWPRHPRSADSIRMGWSSVRFYLDELLEGIATSASIATSRKITASRRILLSVMQDLAAIGRILELLAVQEIIRHVPNAIGLPLLLDSVRNDPMFGLWTNVSDDRVDGCHPRPAGNVS